MGGKVSRALELAHKEQQPNLTLKALGIQHFPPVICDHFIWLIKLALQDNKIVVIPNEIYKLRNLKTLLLSGNRIVSIPPELGMLGHLLTLELDNNMITTLHPDICNIRSLQELTLFYNKLKELPSNIGKLGNLTKLIIEKNELTALPTDIGRLESLQTLHAGDNQIEKLPDTFGEMKSLTMLSLACNNLSVLPLSFGQLTSLTKLNLRSNHLSSLCPDFYHLSHLTTLALWGNKFTEFPSDITRLTSLTDLSMNGNQIKRIPPSIKRLFQLQKLYLQHNELETLPTELRYLTSLNVLLLQENKLHDLPCEICFLPIQHINLDKNPLPTSITEFIQQDHKLLLTHLHNEFELKQAQLVVVIQRRYRLYLKTRRFFNIVKLVVATDKQAKLVEQFQMDLKKKQAVIRLQKAFRSWLRRKAFRAIVADAHTIHRRSSSVTALIPPPNAIYVFTDDQIRDIKFDEPDVEETITWTDITDNSAILRRSFRNLSTDTKIIRSATIIKLVEHMTSEYSETPNFCDCLLYTLETFTTASCFLDFLAKRYSDASAAEDIALKSRIADVIQRWIQNHFYYVEQYPMFTSKLQSYISNTLSVDFPTLADDLLTEMEARKAPDVGIKTMAGVTSLVEFLATAPKPHSIPRDITPKNLNLCLDIHTEEIARQLTLIDFVLLRRITPLELVNQRWTRSAKTKNAKNVLALIERFNHVSQWIATEICTEESQKLRITKIKRFIDIGMKCLELKNFNGVMQIVTGLSSSAVIRLKSTWANISLKRKDHFAAMEKLMDMHSNYKAYRELLSATPSPCIPFLGLFLTDLTFIDDGNPNFAKTTQINMLKRRLMAEAMRTIISSCSQPYCLVPEALIQEKLMTCEVLDDMTLYKHSLKLERRNTHQGNLRKSLVNAIPAHLRGSSKG